MRIVVTDSYTLNPGDLSWENIEALGKLVVYDRTPVELIEKRCANAEIILTNKVPFNKETLAKLPGLKLISVLATGYNVIDIAAAKERGILVCNVPGYSTPSVAQHVFALLLELTNHVGENSDSTSKGEWQQSVDWCYTKNPITELAGKTFGIVGLGNIGRQVATIAHAFGMKVIYYNPTPKEHLFAKAYNLQMLFKESDVITLHCPLKEDNHQFVNKDLLELMKPTAYLVNTSRGQLIDEEELAQALNNNTIAGAALDVLSVEPPKDGNPLVNAKNCIITPHTAWMSKEARQRIMETTAVNILAFLEGGCQNKVS